MSKEKEPIIAPLDDSDMDNVTGGMSRQPAIKPVQPIVSETEAVKGPHIPGPRPQPIMEREG